MCIGKYICVDKDAKNLFIFKSLLHVSCKYTYSDSVVVPMLALGTGLLSGIIVFSVLGFMAHETGLKISDVVTQGLDYYLNFITLYILIMRAHTQTHNYTAKGHSLLRM